MSDDPKARADARLEAALRDADRHDPRPSYREALRYLRERNEAGFRRALDYFENTLVPGVAGSADPLRAWAEYGLELGRALGPGRLVELDGTGRARPLDFPADASGLVLYIPDDGQVPVLVVRLPRAGTAAQRAAYELLVEGRQTASAYD